MLFLFLQLIVYVTFESLFFDSSIFVIILMADNCASLCCNESSRLIDIENEDKLTIVKNPLSIPVSESVCASNLQILKSNSVLQNHNQTEPKYLADALVNCNNSYVVETPYSGQAMRLPLKVEDLEADNSLRSSTAGRSMHVFGSMKNSSPINFDQSVGPDSPSSYEIGGKTPVIPVSKTSKRCGSRFVHSLLFISILIALCLGVLLVIVLIKPEWIGAVDLVSAPSSHSISVTNINEPVYSLALPIRLIPWMASVNSLGKEFFSSSLHSLSINAYTLTPVSRVEAAEADQRGLAYTPTTDQLMKFISSKNEILNFTLYDATLSENGYVLKKWVWKDSDIEESKLKWRSTAKMNWEDKAVFTVNAQGKVALYEALMPPLLSTSELDIHESASNDLRRLLEVKADASMKWNSEKNIENRRRRRRLQQDNENDSLVSRVRSRFSNLLSNTGLRQSSDNSSSYSVSPGYLPSGDSYAPNLSSNDLAMENSITQGLRSRTQDLYDGITDAYLDLLGTVAGDNEMLQSFTSRLANIFGRG